MTEPRRMTLKVNPTPREVMERQSALYASKLFEEYMVCQPMPVGNYYAEGDIRFTMKFWESNLPRKNYIAPGPPVLVNKLRGRAQQVIFSLNDLVHPSTIQAMSGLSVTSQPLWDDSSRGCGCVR